MTDHDIPNPDGRDTPVNVHSAAPIDGATLAAGKPDRDPDAEPGDDAVAGDIRREGTVHVPLGT